MPAGSGSWLKSFFTILRYDMATAVPGRIWPFLVLMLAGLLLVGSESDPLLQLLSEAFFVEALFPLLVGLISYRLILIDREKQRLGFLRTRETLSKTWGHRLTSLMVVAIPSLGIMWLGWHFMGKSSLPFASALFSFGSSALALISVGSTAAFLARQVPVGDLILVFWWGFCFLSYRAAYHILGALYLFPLWYSLRIESDVAMQTHLPRWPLFAFSVTLLLLCFVLLEREE